MILVILAKFRNLADRHPFEWVIKFNLPKPILELVLLQFGLTLHGTTHFADTLSKYRI